MNSGTDPVVRWRRSRPYARARATRTTIDAPRAALELLSQSPSEIKRFAMAVRGAARRLRWRRLHQMRCSKIAAALAAGSRALGAAYAGRERQTDKVWHLRARSEGGDAVVAVMVAPMRITRFKSFAEVVKVSVVRPEFVDAAMLSTELDRINRTWGGRMERQRAG